MKVHHSRLNIGIKAPSFGESASNCICQSCCPISLGLVRLKEMVKVVKFGGKGRYGDIKGPYRDKLYHAAKEQH